LGLEFDQYTLSKLVGGNNNLFIQFVDKAWSRVKDWDTEAKEYLQTPELIVATVITDDEENAGVQELYSLSSFPSFVFFPKGQKNGPFDSLTDAEDANEAFEFMKSKLSPELGKLRKLASQFVASNDKDALIAKAKVVVEDMSEVFKHTGELFVKTMQTISQKGSDFVKKEQERLNGLVSNPNTVEKQKKDFKKRLGILKAFA